MNALPRFLIAALLMCGFSTAAWADFHSECVASDMEAGAAGIMPGEENTIVAIAGGKQLSATRRFCPRDPARAFWMVRLVTYGNMHPSRRIPKVTVVQNGTVLGWFGAEYPGWLEGGSPTARGSGFSWLPAKTDFFAPPSTVFNNSVLEHALVPDAGVNFDPLAPFTLITNDDFSPFSSFAAHGTSLFSVIANRVNGLWGDPAEPGWGVMMKRNADGIVFANWHTYDENGLPIWLVMPNGRPVAKDIVEGEVYFPHGPALSSAAYDPKLFNPGVPVGKFRVRFENGNVAAFDFDVNGHRGTKRLQRQVLTDENGIDCTATSNVYSDAAQTGWALGTVGGLHTGDAVYGGATNCPVQGLVATYGTDGRPTWLFVGAAYLDRQFAFSFEEDRYQPGDLFEPRGTFYGAPYVRSAFALGNAVGAAGMIFNTFGHVRLGYTHHGFQKGATLPTFNY